MGISTATLENEASTKTKHMPILWADVIIPKINECAYAPKDTYKNANSGPIQNNQSYKTLQCLLKSEWKNKLWHIHVTEKYTAMTVPHANWMNLTNRVGGHTQTIHTDNRLQNSQN